LIGVLYLKGTVAPSMTNMQGVLYLKGTVAPSMTNMQGVLYLKGTVAPSMTNMQSVPIITKVVSLNHSHGKYSESHITCTSNLEK
jgi:hypothetical protein